MAPKDSLDQGPTKTKLGRRKTWNVCFKYVFPARACKSNKVLVLARQLQEISKVYSTLIILNPLCTFRPFWASDGRKQSKRYIAPALRLPKQLSLLTLTEEMFCDALSQDGTANASSSLTRSEPGFHGQWDALPGSLLVLRSKKNMKLNYFQHKPHTRTKSKIHWYHIMWWRMHWNALTSMHFFFVCAMLAFRTPSCTASEMKFSLPRYPFQILQNWNTGHESCKLTPGGSTSHRLKVRQPIRYVLLPWQAMANYWHPMPANLVICKFFVT